MSDNTELSLAWAIANWLERRYEKKGGHFENWTAEALALMRDVGLTAPTPAAHPPLLGVQVMSQPLTLEELKAYAAAHPQTVDADEVPCRADDCGRIGRKKPPTCDHLLCPQTTVQATPSQPAVTREELSELIAREVCGVEKLSDLYSDKREYISDRGRKWDVNYPYQCDVVGAADAILALIHPKPAAQGDGE